MRRFFTSFLALSLCAFITTGCAIGFNAPTNQQKPSGNGTSLNSENIQIRDASVVIDPTKPGRAAFIGTVINTADTQDTLEAVEVDPAIGTGAMPNTMLDKNQPAIFGYGGTQPLGLTVNSSVKAGNYIEVHLVFANNDMIPLSILVNVNEGNFQSVVVP